VDETQNVSVCGGETVEPITDNGHPHREARCASQMAPYSFYTALLLTRAHRVVVHFIGNRVLFGTAPSVLSPTQATV
jgi:hypothetical protein